jgi:hypothetical protein
MVLSVACDSSRIFLWPFIFWRLEWFVGVATTALRLRLQSLSFRDDCCRLIRLQCVYAKHVQDSTSRPGVVGSIFQGFQHARSERRDYYYNA